LNKSAGVALIEAAGSMLATTIYVVAFQHIYVTVLLREPDTSWMRMAWHWYKLQRSQALTRRIQVFQPLRASAEEP
jgi:hypothetical protein